MKQPEMKHVKLCEKCCGEGEVMGAAMRIFCPTCHGTRFQSAEEGTTLSVHALNMELYETRTALAAALDNLNSKPLSTGPECGRYISNSRGPGGSNFTGD